MIEVVLARAAALDHSCLTQQGQMVTHGRLRLPEQTDERADVHLADLHQVMHDTEPRFVGEQFEELHQIARGGITESNQRGRCAMAIVNDRHGRLGRNRDSCRERFHGSTKIEAWEARTGCQERRELAILCAERGHCGAAVMADRSLRGERRQAAVAYRDKITCRFWAVSNS